MKKPVLLLLTCMLSTAGWADDLIKSNCEQPTIPSEFASELANKSFDRHLKEYKKCVDKFVEEQRSIAKTSAVSGTANNANNAAELAVKEYNDFTVDLKNRNQKASGESN